MEEYRVGNALAVTATAKEETCTAKLPISGSMAKAGTFEGKFLATIVRGALCTQFALLIYS
jgi:hypothetical protein